MDTQQPNKDTDTTEKPIIERLEETPESPSAVPVTQPLPAKKSSKKRLVVLVAVVVVLVIAAALTAILFLNKKTTKTTTNAPIAATHFASPDILVTQAKTSLSGAIVPTPTMNGLGGTTADGFSTYSYPAYQVEGKSFKNLPESGTGAGYSGELSIAEANYKELVKFFEANHFKASNTSKDTTGPISSSNDVTFHSYAEYSSDNLLCAIWNADASQTPLKTYIASIGCASKDSYQKAANSLQPFYDGYTKQNATHKNLVFGDPVAAEGQDGYKNAVLYQEDPAEIDTSEDRAYFNGLYYQAPGSSEWKFFTGVGTGSLLNCTEFNTDILKKAFHNLNCYNTTAKATAKV